MPKRKKRWDGPIDKLPPDLRAVFQVFYLTLKEARQEGRITRKKAKPAAQIAKALSGKFHMKLSDADIRGMTHLARVNFIPVMTNDNGSYWGLDEADFDDTIDHLDARERSIREAKLHVIKMKDVVLNKKTPSLFDDHSTP
jgi:ATP-dependent helicase/DNAse subunit B